ncbi:hypothetical protein SLE2022_372550 [Rubroshorea leprosula]
MPCQQALSSSKKLAVWPRLHIDHPHGGSHQPSPEPTASRFPFKNPQLLIKVHSVSFPSNFLTIFILSQRKMVQEVVLRVLTMTDDKTKQKAIEAAADIYGIDSIAADQMEQKLTVIGEMDTVAVVKKLKKVGKVDIISVGPAKEEKQEEKKEEKKEEEKK